LLPQGEHLLLARPGILDDRLLAPMQNWTMQKGGLYFVTPSVHARPAKVEVLVEFLVERLSKPV
jgi:hypothetical protein